MKGISRSGYLRQENRQAKELQGIPLVSDGQKTMRKGFIKSIRHISQESQREYAGTRKEQQPYMNMKEQVTSRKI